MSEILSLPKGWFVLAPSEVFNQVSTSGKKIKTKDCLKIGKYPVIDQGQEYISGYLDDEEKVISIKSPIIMFGDHTKTIKWISKSFIPGADGTKLLNPIPQISSRFFYYQLRSYQLPDKGYARHFQYLDDQPFVVPAFDEQHQIAQRLDELLAQVDTIKARLDAIPAILKRFRQSVLSAAVSGKLTEEWRGRNLYVPTKYGLDIPVNWESLFIDDIAEVKGGKRLPKGESLVNYDTGYPYIRAGQLKNGTVKSIDQLYLEPHVQKQISKYTVNENDTYVTIVGASIGDAGLIPKQFSGANLTENAAKFCNYKKELCVEYLSFWLQSQYLQNLIKFEIKSGAQGKLALSRIKKLPIPYPTKEEQVEIVKQIKQFFSLAEQIAQHVTNAKARVDKLTQSILAKAFRGELTADWRAEHPELISGENSAEALLAKIQAAKAALDGKKKKGKAA